MPKLSKHSKDDVYKSIMGSTAPTNENGPEIQAGVSEEQPMESNSISNKKNTDSDLDKLVHKSYYITKRHVKALKIRTALSDKQEEKDFSAIVRAALDLYLADTLKDI